MLELSVEQFFDQEGFAAHPLPECSAVYEIMKIKIETHDGDSRMCSI